MVAIHVPRTRDDDRAARLRAGGRQLVALPDHARPRRPGDPASGRGDGALARPRCARPSPRARALPDRATRVRRRRLALLVVVVVVAGLVVATVRVTAALVDIGGSSGPEPIATEPAPTGPGAAPVAGEAYVVQPGDTLWSIATEVAPDEDPRVVVDALRAANGGPDLEVGERLVINLG
jgi:LysM domain